jgi:hypothetical protein
MGGVPAAFSKIYCRCDCPLPTALESQPNGDGWVYSHPNLCEVRELEKLSRSRTDASSMHGRLLRWNAIVHSLNRVVPEPSESTLICPPRFVLFPHLRMHPRTPGFPDLAFFRLHCTTSAKLNLERRDSPRKTHQTPVPCGHLPSLAAKSPARDSAGSGAIDRHPGTLAATDDARSRSDNGSQALPARATAVVSNSAGRVSATRAARCSASEDPSCATNFLGCIASY